jgi:hypothetical protein
MKKSNDRHRPLLCARRERPRRRCAAEEGEEGAAVHGCFRHSITSSARPSSVMGKVMPSTVAVFILMMNSLVDCCTGSSEAFSPFKIRAASEWIAQQLTEALGWKDAPRYLIRDRDSAYGEAFSLGAKWR